MIQAKKYITFVSFKLHKRDSFFDFFDKKRPKTNKFQGVFAFLLRGCCSSFLQDG